MAIWVARSSAVALATVIVALGLPAEAIAIAIIAGIDVFMEMGRTTVNVMGNTVPCYSCVSSEA